MNKVELQTNIQNHVSTSKEVEDTLYFLQNNHSIKQWQVMMNKLYLCHLLGWEIEVQNPQNLESIPIIKVMNKTMKLWLCAVKEIPKVDGKVAIHEIVNTRIKIGTNISSKKQSINLFEKLFASAMAEELELISNEELKRRIVQTPVFRELLPGYELTEKLSFKSTCIDVLSDWVQSLLSFLRSVLMFFLTLAVLPSHLPALFNDYSASDST